MCTAIIALLHLRVIAVCMPAVLLEDVQKMNEFCFNRHKSHTSYRHDAQILDCLRKTNLTPVILPPFKLELLPAQLLKLEVGT